MISVGIGGYELVSSGANDECWELYKEIKGYTGIVGMIERVYNYRLYVSEETDRDTKITNEEQKEQKDKEHDE